MINPPRLFHLGLKPPGTITVNGLIIYTYILVRRWIFRIINASTVISPRAYIQNDQRIEGYFPECFTPSDNNLGGLIIMDIHFLARL